jgi:hypothetical protein
MDIIHKIFLLLLIISVLPLAYSITYSQDNTQPCSAPEAAMLDFWVGHWDLEWTNTEGKTEKGTNTINKILGSCVIEENFSTEDASFQGKSVSVFDSRKLIWKQTWVDNTGSYMDFTGGKYGDSVMFSRKVIDKKGAEHIQRMVFYNITAGSLMWNWESSSDDGKSWTLLWKISYKRRG